MEVSDSLCLALWGLAHGLWNQLAQVCRSWPPNGSPIPHPRLAPCNLAPNLISHSVRLLEPEGQQLQVGLGGVTSGDLGGTGLYCQRLTIQYE